MGSFADWQNSVVGRQIDVDGAYGDQCVDIAESFCKYFWPDHDWPTELGYGNAKDLYANSNPTYFQKIPYSGGFEAQQGDLIVYNGTASNPFGHIAAVISGTPSDVLVVEQNGFNPTGVAYTTHRSYTNCIGVIRPKGVFTMGRQPIDPTTVSQHYSNYTNGLVQVAPTDPAAQNRYEDPNDDEFWYGFAPQLHDLLTGQMKRAETAEGELTGERAGYAAMVKSAQDIADVVGVQHNPDQVDQIAVLNAVKTLKANQGTGGGFTPDDRATLNWIQKAIASIFRIQV